MTIVENFGGKWNTVDAVQTERGAHTIAVDPKTHRIYLLGADYGTPSGKSGVLPDTFHFLVVGVRKARSSRVETSDFAVRLSRTYRQPNTQVEPSSRVNAAQQVQTVMLVEISTPPTFIHRVIVRGIPHRSVSK